jgi:outer membrane protein TolC
VVDYTKELLKYSSSTIYIDVLTSEQSLLTAQLNGISDKLQQLQAVINLYRSLAGEWKKPNIELKKISSPNCLTLIDIAPGVSWKFRYFDEF